MMEKSREIYDENTKNGQYTSCGIDQIFEWRKGWDLNPRRCYPRHLSKMVPSATRPFFHWGEGRESNSQLLEPQSRVLPIELPTPCVPPFFKV